MSVSITRSRRWPEQGADCERGCRLARERTLLPCRQQPFITAASYGHLRFKAAPLWKVIPIS